MGEWDTVNLTLSNIGHHPCEGGVRLIKSYVIVVNRPKMVGKVLNRVYVFPIKVLYMLKKS